MQTALSDKEKDNNKKKLFDKTWLVSYLPCFEPNGLIPSAIPQCCVDHTNTIFSERNAEMEIAGERTITEEVELIGRWKEKPEKRLPNSVKRR